MVLKKLSRCLPAARTLASAVPASLTQPQPRAARVLQPPPTYISTLENGVKFGSQNLGGNLCTIGIWLDLGSRHEHQHQAGSAALLEHLFFEKKPELTKRLTALGIPDAYTARDVMAVYVSCMPDKANEVIDLLSEMVLSADVSDEAFHRAKQNAISKLNESDRDPALMLNHYLHAQAYMNTPLQSPPEGTYHSLTALTPETFADFRQNGVKAARIAVSAAGNVDHDQIAKIVEKTFASVGNDYHDTVPEVDKPSRYISSYVYHREDSWPYCYGMVAMEGPGYDNVDDFVRMNMARCFMGSWDRMKTPYETSPYRLPQRIGWFEHTRLYDSFYYPYYGTGLWGQYFVVKPDKADAFNEEHMKEWRYLSTFANEKDVKAAANLYKNELFRALESHVSVADDVARQLLRYGRIVGVPELTAIAEETTATNFKDTCHNYLYDRDPTIVGFGQTGNMQFHEWLTVKYRTYWWGR